MTDTAWIARIIEQARRQQAAQRLEREYFLEMRRRWLALAPDIFAYIASEIKSACAEVSATVDCTVVAGSVTLRAVSGSVLQEMHIRLNTETERIVCDDGIGSRRQYKLVISHDDAFTLHEYHPMGNRAWLPIGGAAKGLIEPFLRNAIVATPRHGESG